VNPVFVFAASLLGVTALFVGYPLLRFSLVATAGVLGYQWGLEVYSQVLSNWWLSAPHPNAALLSAGAGAFLFVLASWWLFGITVFTVGTTLGFWLGNMLFGTAWISVGLLALAGGIAFTVLATPLLILVSTLVGALTAVSLPAYWWGYLGSPFDLLLLEAPVPLPLRGLLSVLTVLLATSGAIYQMQRFATVTEGYPPTDINPLPSR
jgi:hypothetical protein